MTARTAKAAGATRFIRRNAWVGMTVRRRDLLPELFHDHMKEYDGYQRVYPTQREALKHYQCVARCVITVFPPRARRPKR